MEIPASAFSFFMAQTVLDIQLIDTNDVLTLGIVDLSIYPHPGNVTSPSLQITPPAYPTINVSFTPESINIYNSTHLNVNCPDKVPLDDGEYTFIYSQGGQTITKTFFRVTNIKCGYSQAVLKVDTDCCGKQNTEFQRKLQNIKLLIEGCIASSNQCDSLGAYNKYTAARKLLSNINTCNC